MEIVILYTYIQTNNDPGNYQNLNLAFCNKFDLFMKGKGTLE